MRLEKPQDEIVISAVGAISSVGASAAQTFASVRADLSRMRECPELYSCIPEDQHGEPSPLVAAPIYHLETPSLLNRRPVEWLGLMAGHALRDLLRRARLPLAAFRELGLFCSVPSHRPGWPANADGEFFYHLHNCARIDLVSSRRLLASERTGALALCDRAREALLAKTLRYAVVGGIDSYLFRDWLEPLDRDYRLLSDRAMDGFRPGEGAAFFLLELRTEATRRGAKPLAVLRGSTVTRWTGLSTASSAKPASATPRSPNAGRTIPNTGAALADAIAPLVAAGPEPFLLCDQNGESARTKEWGFALGRLGKALRLPLALELPMSVLGDLGAATGAMLVTLAVQFFEKKHTAKRHALVFCAADDGERRALLLERA